MTRKRKIQIILDGKKIEGTCYQMKGGHNSVQQVVEYRGRRSHDPSSYRNNADQSAMLWEARRILANLYEESDKEELPSKAVQAQ